MQEKAVSIIIISSKKEMSSIFCNYKEASKWRYVAVGMTQCKALRTKLMARLASSKFGLFGILYLYSGILSPGGGGGFLPISPFISRVIGTC